MADNENAATNESTPKKSKKMLIIIVLLVVLLGGGGGGGFYFWTRMASAKAAEKAAAEGEHKEDKHAKKEGSEKFNLPSDEDVKGVVELPPFIVNLADIEQARYLRMSVSVGVGEAGEEKPDTLFLTRVKNAMLSVLATKTSTDVLTVEGKQKLREELLEAAQAASSHPEVKAVYITDFIVQL